LNRSVIGPELVPKWDKSDAFGQSSPRWNFQSKSNEKWSRGDSAAGNLAAHDKIQAAARQDRKNETGFAWKFIASWR
jgi:hypothetical protein